MTDYTLHITIILQTLADGQYLGEVLGFPELSTFGSNDQSIERHLKDGVKVLAADGKARDVYQRQVAGKPELHELTLEIEPPKRNEAWHTPVRLTLHAVRQNRGDGVRIAYVPALQIAVVAGSEAELKERLAKEVRFALQRTKKATSLAKLALLQQVEDVELRRAEIAVTLKSPKALALELDAETEDAKSVLEEVATDLGRLEEKDKDALPAAYHVDALLERIVEALAAEEPQSVLLVGKSGVGKTAAVFEVVRQRTRRQLGATGFWATSGARLIAGAMGFGMWQERCQKLIREAGRRKAIIYLGNLVELLEVGKSNVSNMGIAAFLRPAIARGQLQVICECTVEQVTLLERQDPHLLAAFRQVTVDEPPAETARRILRDVAGEYLAGVKPEALVAVELLHRRFGTYSPFPGRAVRFLRNLLHKRPAEKAVEVRDVMAAFAGETGLPRFMLDDEVPLDLDGAHAWFSSRLIRQEAAVEMVVDVLAAVKAGLARPKRPIASLMFIGPTGVGKTEMAKALAEYFFSDRARLTRFDMSEYGAPAAVTRLIGSAIQEEGLLTAAVRQQPFSVILLDEVEKADGSLFDLLLQVFGEGRLTDASGRLADFSNSIVIMTSNLGAQSFGRESFGLGGRGGRGRPDAAAHFTEEVRDFLRPEVFNRIDRIIPFLPLGQDAIRKIAARELELIRERDGIKLREGGGIDLVVSAEALEHLAQGGYDARYGARPLKRTLERDLMAPLAEAVNAHGVDTPLAAEVVLGAREGKAALEIRVRAKDTPARKDALVLTAQERIVNVRRLVQRLARCSAVLALQNDVFQLERQILRAQERKRNLPELPQWRERLRRLSGPAKELKALQVQVAEMEDGILTRFYGQSTGRVASGAELDTLDARWNALLRDIYCLRFENPDHIVLGLFSEDRPRLFELARVYHKLALQRECKVDAAWFGRDRRGMLRYRAPAIEVLTGKVEAFGLALGIDGVGVLPWYEGESGSHWFYEKGRESACLVMIDAGTLDDFTPPQGSDRVGGIQHPGRRRLYYAESKGIEDEALGEVANWTELSRCVGELMDRRLKQAMWGMLDA